MGVKYSGFGDYTAALSGAVMANYNCDTNQTVPLFNLGQYSFNLPGRPRPSKRSVNHSGAAFGPPLFPIRSFTASAVELRIATLTCS